MGIIPTAVSLVKVWAASLEQHTLPEVGALPVFMGAALGQRLPLEPHTLSVAEYFFMPLGEIATVLVLFPPEGF